jgi:predicted transcriptional regulator YheO
LSKKYLEQFFPLVDAIAETFGKNCEVVLHDLSKPEKSIIKIANGHVTGRTVGAPLTDLGLLLFEKEKKSDKNKPLVGYHTKTKRGADLKSTTVFIRNNKGKVLGCLCINVDVTPYKATQSILEEFCKTSVFSDVNVELDSPEKFESSIDTLINELLVQSIKKIGKPLGYMAKEDKLEIIRDLKKRGLFAIKGAAKKIAKELNVSLPTIYKYMEEIYEI